MVAPKKAAGVAALLTVIPTMGYAYWSPEASPYLAVVNTVLIAAALYLMMSSADDAVAPA